MTDIIIHNIKISYDESHERVRDFVKYLKDEKRKEELKGFYEEIRHSKDNKIHINDIHNNEFTLERVGEHMCTLNLRGM
ncbi:MAG TPA: hypothetical protein PKZ36_02305 [Candidatus Paceibacterota bacterium]|nr:hypothetical protein [Candidatus Paceibacterota bacterium]HPT18214.1 hypothetical protein [Candidatus Paceibacterota bacterium]